eukprot:ANDGO_02967.mRNA.1 hypothetical protein
MEYSSSSPERIMNGASSIRSRALLLLEEQKRNRERATAIAASTASYASPSGGSTSFSGQYSISPSVRPSSSNGSSSVYSSSSSSSSSSSLYNPSLSSNSSLSSYSSSFGYHPAAPVVPSDQSMHQYRFTDAPLTVSNSFSSVVPPAPLTSSFVSSSLPVHSFVPSSSYSSTSYGPSQPSLYAGIGTRAHAISTPLYHPLPSTSYVPSPYSNSSQFAISSSRPAFSADTHIIQTGSNAAGPDRSQMLESMSLGTAAPSIAVDSVREQLKEKYFPKTTLSPQLPVHSTSSHSSSSVSFGADVKPDYRQASPSRHLSPGKSANEDQDARFSRNLSAGLVDNRFEEMVALKSHVPASEFELNLEVGEVISVMRKPGSSMWFGMKDGGDVGLFPSACVARQDSDFSDVAGRRENNASVRTDRIAENPLAASPIVRDQDVEEESVIAEENSPVRSQPIRAAAAPRPPPVVTKFVSIKAVVVTSHIGRSREELSIRAGANVLVKGSKQQFLLVEDGRGRAGLVPRSNVRHGKSGRPITDEDLGAVMEPHSSPSEYREQDVARPLAEQDQPADMQSESFEVDHDVLTVSHRFDILLASGRRVTRTFCVSWEEELLFWTRGDVPVSPGSPLVQNARRDGEILLNSISGLSVDNSAKRRATCRITFSGGRFLDISWDSLRDPSAGRWVQALKAWWKVMKGRSA